MRTLRRSDNPRTEIPIYRQQRRLNGKKFPTTRLLNVKISVGSNNEKLRFASAQVHRPHFNLPLQGKSTFNSSQYASFDRPLLATNERSYYLNNYCNSNDVEDDGDYEASLFSATKGSDGKYVWKKPSVPTVSVQAPVRKVLNRVNQTFHSRGIHTNRGIHYFGKQSHLFHQPFRDSRDDDEEVYDEEVALLRENDASLRSLSYLNLEVSHSLSNSSSGPTQFFQVVDFGGFEEPTKSDDESSCVITEGTSTDSIDNGKSSSLPSDSTTSLDAASSKSSRKSPCDSSSSHDSQLSMPKSTATDPVDVPSSPVHLPSTVVSSSTKEEDPLGSNCFHKSTTITRPNSHQAHSTNTSASMEVFDQLKNKMKIKRVDSDGSSSFVSSSIRLETTTPDDAANSPYQLTSNVDVFNKLKENITMNRKGSEVLSSYPPTDISSVCTDFSGHSSVQSEAVGHLLRKAEMKRNESDTTSTSLVGLLISPESTGSFCGCSSSNSPSDSLAVSSIDELETEIEDIQFQEYATGPETTIEAKNAGFAIESMPKSPVTDEVSVESEKTIDFDSEWDDICIKSGAMSSAITTPVESSTEKVHKLNHITPLWNTSSLLRRKYQGIQNGGSGSFEQVDTTHKGQEFDFTSVVVAPVMSPESSGKLCDVKVKLEPTFQDVCEVAEANESQKKPEVGESSMQRKNIPTAETFEELGVETETGERNTQAQAMATAFSGSPLDVATCNSISSNPTTTDARGDDSSTEDEYFHREDWDCDEADSWSKSSQPFGSFTLHEEVLHDIREKAKSSNFFTKEGESESLCLEKVPSLNSLSSLPEMINTNSTSLPSESFHDLSMGAMMSFSMLHLIVRSSYKVEEESPIDSAPPSLERIESMMDALNVSTNIESELETDEKLRVSSPTRSGAFRFNTYDETTEDESSEDSESDCDGGASCGAFHYVSSIDLTQTEEIGEVDSFGRLSDISESEHETSVSDDGASHFDRLKSFWSNQWKEDTEESTSSKYAVRSDATADIQSSVSEVICDDFSEDDDAIAFQERCVDEEKHENDEEEDKHEDSHDYLPHYIPSFHRAHYLEDIMEVEHESDLSNDSEDSEQNVPEEIASVVIDTHVDIANQIIGVESAETGYPCAIRTWVVELKPACRNELEVVTSNDKSSDNDAPDHYEQDLDFDAASNGFSYFSTSKNHVYTASEIHENIQRVEQENQARQFVFRSSKTAKRRYLFVKKRAVAKAKEKKSIKFGLWSLDKDFNRDKIVQLDGTGESLRSSTMQESEHFQDEDVDNVLSKAMHVLTRLEDVSDQGSSDVDLLSTTYDHTKELEDQFIFANDEHSVNCLVLHETPSQSADETPPENSKSRSTCVSCLSITSQRQIRCKNVPCSSFVPSANEIDFRQCRSGDECEEPIDQCKNTPGHAEISSGDDCISVESAGNENSNLPHDIVGDDGGKGRITLAEENVEEGESEKIDSANRSRSMTQKLLDENIELAETLAATQSELVKLNHRLEIMTMERNQLLKKSSKNKYCGVDDETRELLEWLESTDEIESI